MKVSCTQAGCHAEASLDDGSERADDFHDRHRQDTDCSACHVQSVLACDSCHFNTEIPLPGTKRFYAQAPRTGSKFLRNKDGKVRTATYQSLTWDNAEAFYAMAPYVAHTITKGETVECEDCHLYVKGKGQGKKLNITRGYAALAQYLTEKRVTATKWVPETTNLADQNYGTLTGPTGVIPVPLDWATTLEFDHVYWTGPADALPLVSGGAGGITSRPGRTWCRCPSARRCPRNRSTG